MRTRRVPVEDFPLFTAEEPRDALFSYIASCLEDGTPMPSDLLKRASEPAPEIIEKKRRKKRKAYEEGCSKKLSKHSKRKGNSSSAIPPVVESVPEPTSQPIISTEPNPFFEPHPPSPQTISDFVADIDTTNPTEPNSPPPEPIHIFDASTPTQPEKSNPHSASVPHPEDTSFSPPTSLPSTPSSQNPQQSLFVDAPSSENPNHPDPTTPPGSVIFNPTPLLTLLPISPAPSSSSSADHSFASTPPHNSPNHPLDISSPDPPHSTDQPSSSSEPTPYAQLLLSFIEAYLKHKPRPGVGNLLSRFETEMKIWIYALKEKCIHSLNPHDSEVIWTAFRKRFTYVTLNLQEACSADALEKFSEALRTVQLCINRSPVRLLENKPDIVVCPSSSKYAVEPQIVEDLHAEEVTSEAQVVEETPSSDQPSIMEIETAPPSLVFQTLTDLKKESEDVQSKFAQQEATNNEFKEWVVKQEKSTTEIQDRMVKQDESTTEIKGCMAKQDESNANMQTWMAKQDESTSEMKEILRALASRKS